jgi:heavy metal sensor kinase
LASFPGSFPGSFPIRARLTAWYVGLLAAMLTAVGLFLPLRLNRDLVAGIDRTLDAGAAQISPANQETEVGFQDTSDLTLAGLTGAETAAQTLSVTGTVVLHSGDPASQSAMLPPASGARVLAGACLRTSVSVGSDHEPYRLLALPLGAGQGRQVLVVASSLDEVDRSVHRLRVLLLAVVPAALLAAAGGGWWLARKALRPVAEITRQAGAIGVEQLHERVPVPPTHDEVAGLATTINAMLERIEDGVREKRRFLADASHELRTPLAVMRSEIEVSLRAGGIEPAAREVLASNAEEVERMSRIVDDLLTLARIDEGRLELLRSRVDLGAVAADVAGSLRPLAEAQGIPVTVSGDRVEVDADPEHLRRAVRNLVENAVKYTGAGGRVDLEVWRRNGEAGLTVTDTGPGIPEALLERIFDRFVRADMARSRSTGGSGLGLSITREIVEAHGGRVWAESTPGVGSAFSMGFPPSAHG